MSTVSHETGEQSGDGSMYGDDSFRELDELNSVGNNNVMVEEWGDDFLVSESDGPKSDLSGFEQELDRIYEEQQHQGPTRVVPVTSTEHAEVQDEETIGDAEEQEVDEAAEDNAPIEASNPEKVVNDVSRISTTTGYEAEMSNNMDETYQEDENDDEEEPPPPPHSPPPHDDFDEDATTVTRSTKASSMNIELFEDIIYRAGNDREGLPVVVFLPCDIPKVLRVDEEKEREQLLSYCIDFLGDVASKGSYVLVIAAAGEAKNLFPARSAVKMLAEIHARLPRIPHKKSLRKIIILHPDTFTSFALSFLYRKVSLKFWKKVVFVKRVADLDAFLEPNSEGEQVSLPLPEEVLFYDITDAVGMDSTNRGRAGSVIGRQARVRAESEAPNPPTSFHNFWQVSSSFGVPLAATAAKTPFNLPAIVTRCVTYLCLHGVKTPGIFRVPGNADTVADAKRRLESGLDVDLGGYWSKSGRPATVEDVHVCAALLKTFVRELPKPILSHAAYQSIMLESESQTDQFSLATTMKDVCELLNRPNRLLLQYLSYFMQYVVSHEQYNHMTATNLAIVWVPNLFRDEADPDDPNKELRMLPHAMRAALIMFTHAKTVFPMETYSILPICYDLATGEPLPVEKVCIRDVTQASAGKIPLEVDEREFDSMITSKLAPSSSFYLRSVLTPTNATQDSSIAFFNAAPDSITSGAVDPEISVHLSSMTEPQSVDELNKLSIRDLKGFLVKNGYDPSSCLERNDLRKMGLECFRSKHGVGAPNEQEESVTSSPLMARPPQTTLRRSMSFDQQQRRRRSSEGVASEDSIPKRNSDLGRQDRRDSDMAFISALRKAGLPVAGDELLDDASSEFTLKTGGSSTAGGGQKRDFGQVVQNGQPSQGASKAGFVSSFLRRKSILTRDNKRDLAKSARFLKSSPIISTPPTPVVSASPEQSPASLKRRVAAKNRSQSPEVRREPSLEDTLRALRETPLFGEERSSGSRPASLSSSSHNSSGMLSAPPPPPSASPQDRAPWKLPGTDGTLATPPVVNAPKPKSPVSNATNTASTTLSNKVDVGKMGAKELKALLTSHGKDFKDCFSVEDLREKAKHVMKG